MVALLQLRRMHVFSSPESCTRCFEFQRPLTLQPVDLVLLLLHDQHFAVIKQFLELCELLGFLVKLLVGARLFPTPHLFPSVLVQEEEHLITHSLLHYSPKSSVIKVR